MRLGEVSVDIVVYTYGLLLYHERQDRTRCTRIGLCFWVSGTSQGFKRRTGYAELEWTYHKGLFE